MLLISFISKKFKQSRIWSQLIIILNFPINKNKGAKWESEYTRGF